MAQIDYNNVVIGVEKALKGIDEQIDKDNGINPPPESDKDAVASYVTSLFKDSEQWRQNSFANRYSYGTQNFSNPVDFFRACRQLEAGLHWDVWGRRNQDPPNDWKQELVDNEIGNQIRVRRSYLAANWHEISILPNIQNLDQILTQERHDTAWGDLILSVVSRMLIEGTAITKTILDRSKRSEGLIREILIDNASAFPTPFATDFGLQEGCWYFIHATAQNESWVKAEYPDFDASKLAGVNYDWASKVSTSKENLGEEQVKFAKTKLLPVYECWVDDDTVERYSDQADAVEAENTGLLEGREAVIDLEDDDRAHLDGHVKFLQQITDRIDSPAGSPNPELDQALAEFMSLHIAEHMAQLKSKIDAGLKVGYRQKYPFGRKIVVIGDQVAEDLPNPLEVAWRSLFNKVVNEKVIGYWWGRGVPEILWETNRTMDTMLSRTADIALTVGMPKRYFAIEDKEQMKQYGLDNNDPTKPAFATRPPTYSQGNSPREHMEIYSAAKQDSQRQLGVSDVSYGSAPGASVSGKLVETLLAQNSVIVTGEANQRLNSLVEDLVETRIELYKNFYVEPRYWMINGQPKLINLSDALQNIPVTNPDGSVSTVDVPYFQVYVRPNSNFPRQFEFELSFMLELMQMNGVSPDGTPFVTTNQVRDFLSQKYPEFARTTEYAQESEIIKLGRQKLAELQAQQEEEARTQQKVKDAVQRKGINAMLGGGQ